MANNKILVVDDSRVIRVRVTEMLPPGNFEVLEAKDGLEALNFIRQERPNLIMLDFLLPKLSGWEVFQQLQQNADWQKIPLVVMSGRKEEVLEKIPEPFAYFEFISKPFEQKELMAAIKSAMAKAKLRPSTPVLPATKDAPPGAPNSENIDIDHLNAKVIKMQTEIDGLKKQLMQMMTFIQQNKG